MQPSDEKPAPKSLTYSSVSRLPKMRWENMLPLATRLLVWGLFFGLLALLSSFFTLIFLTFVFAYLQSGLVDVFARYLPRQRTLLVVLVGLLLLGGMTTVSIFVAPNVYRQAAVFTSDFSSYMERMDTELLTLAERYPVLKEAIPELGRSEPVTRVPDWAILPGTKQTEAAPRAFKDSPTGLLLELLVGTGEVHDGRDAIKMALDKAANLSRQTLAILSTFLLAFLFSFLIVLDLPHLAASVRDLENTRLRFIYVEVANNIYEFGKVLGHAMQAQFYIACVNTVLTALGLSWLGMGEQVAFLSVVVFLCSFIPVVGVFISSIPICLLALTMGGTSLVLMCVGMIILVHMVEGYFLNPLIYGARLRINPVIVLIILTVGGKLFHIWGLILGVPVCTYIFGYAIRYEKMKVAGRMRPLRRAR